MRRGEEGGDVSIRGRRRKKRRRKGVIGDGDDMVFNPEVGRVHAPVTPDL